MRLGAAQVRLERPRPSYSRAASTAPTEEGDAAQAAEADSAASATSPGAVDAASSTLNPNAKAFVPSGSPAPAEAAAEKAKAAPASAEDGGDDGDDEDDDDEGDKKEAAAEEEEAVGEPVEITRWAERGVGQIKLLVAKSGESGKVPRMVMRQEQVGRLLLNEALVASTAPAVRASDTSVRLVVVSAAAGPQSYLLRVKTPAEAEQLLSKINSTIPSDSK